ncbi:TetR/AcrR family transcriptional regulator [Nocardia thailandica]|uniref:TetR/AcrR family transcriptional regulator n=1 Tax=Nocardia thailandica TaxID=257275 RepID=UPI0003017FD2|nr:TetR/AcrR family transcriptional regulator [Nocardia thailandica]
MPSPTRSSDALRDAALALIAERGLTTLTLAAVAERAEVSRATAYREFGDKDGMIAAIGRAEIARMVAAAYAEVDVFGPVAETVRAVTLFALSYLRRHAAFEYLCRHEPAWLLGIAVAPGEGGSELALVRTVAALAAPVVALRGGDDLALPATEAAEVVVRIVLSHALIRDSGLTDEQVAETAVRAVVRSG